MSGYVVRDLAGMTEFRAAEALQRTVWGAGDKEDPADLMMAIQSEGGLVGGAFADDRLAGYVFGFPTRDPSVQHSHRLAVHPADRGLGLGSKLKWYQRAWCLARGITVVRWTFDPLRHVNASLNITHLGAVSRTYYPDYYADMGGINAGAPSDRLLVEWLIDSPWVAQRADGNEPAAVSAKIEVDIPEDFDGLLSRDPAAANRERLRVREALTSGLRSGLVVRGYDVARRAYQLAA